jgi:hypothetical protein
MSDSAGGRKVTVWILGSGFSKSLGGPLLKDLLVERALHQIAGAIPSIDERPEFRRVLRLHKYGLDNDIWSDAEEFLDLLDVASNDINSGAGRQMCALVYRGLEETFEPNTEEQAVKVVSDLRGEARRFVALQCWRFAARSNTTSESWGAYRLWRDKLVNSGAHHIILTFNYDPVLDMLNVPIPIPSEASDGAMFQQTYGDSPYALKLHGSVAWKNEWPKGYVKPERSWELALCCSDQIAIAAPGPNKHECVDGPLKALWLQGLKEIRLADSIVFVGYRFPPSDAEARSRILGAIGDNKRLNGLTLNIVLGPKLGSDDNVRLRALLEYTALNSGRIPWKRPLDRDQSGYKIIEHPLWAEDFLTVWEPRLTEYRPQ